MVVYRRANRQYVAMTEDEVWSFLEPQRRIYLGFTMRNGFPHVSPIWFVIIDKKIYMRAQDYKVKVALASSGKACCVIDDGDKYRELRGAIIWGRSKVVTEQKLVGRVNEGFEKKYAKRQWKPDEMPERWVRERMKERRSIIELTPLTIDSWDNRKV